MPASFMNDPGHWRQRAEVMRSLAREAEDDQYRQTMLRDATDYERLASRAEERCKGSS